MRKFAMCAAVIFTVALMLFFFWVALSMVAAPAEVLADALAASLMTDGASVNPTAAKVVAWISFVGVIVAICGAFCFLAFDTEEEEEPKPKIPKVPRAKCHRCAHCECVMGMQVICKEFGLCSTRDRCEHMTPRTEDKTDE